MSKSNYMVKLTSTVIKTETWLIEDETKEDAIYIAENQNQSKRYKCTLWKEDESDPEFDDAITKEVSFEEKEDGKGFYWKEKGENNV